MATLSQMLLVASVLGSSVDLVAVTKHLVAEETRSSRSS